MTKKEGKELATVKVRMMFEWNFFVKNKFFTSFIELIVAVDPESSSVFHIQRAEHLDAKHLSSLLHLPLIALHQQVNVTSCSRNLFAKIYHSIY